MNRTVRSKQFVVGVQSCILIAILIFALGTACQPAAPQTIKIGGIFDLTGATSDVGINYANGIRDYVEYINSKGGIGGKQVELIYEDYAYNIPRAEELYGRLVKENKVVAILGWGTGDTEALRPKVAADKIPFMSASYAESLADINQAPYNFLIGVSYSDQMRIALRYIADNWTDTSRKPRVVFLYNDSAFGKSPIQDGKDYAAAHGIELLTDQIVALTAQDATEQLKAIEAEGGADYGIIQQTANATATIVRSAQQMGLKTRFIALNWGTDEKSIALAGQAGEGMLGTSPFAFPYEDVPGMVALRAALQTANKDTTKLDIRYVQGWTSAQVLLAAVEKAGANPTGPSVRQALETLTNYDTGGITASLTFSSSNHKGALALKIYQVKNGQWEPISDYIEATP
jgi:branched-chain amino acid transport system substrate-binding protein